MILVHDAVVADPIGYRQRALAHAFGSVDVGHAVFHGIAPTTDATLPAWIAARYPSLVPTLTFFRQSPIDQVEPNDLHTDDDMGDWTAVLYLTPDPPVEDGTSFWRHRVSGAITGAGLMGDAGRDREGWERWYHVPARFNRCVLFGAPYVHSRALEANYGEGDDARLIQVVCGRFAET
jgi:hypothetical protein